MGFERVADISAYVSLLERCPADKVWATPIVQLYNYTWDSFCIKVCFL